MPLSDDQKAMLRLLAQREQGYDDLAALMGLSVDEVRAKVAETLAQLEREGAEAPPLPAEPEPAPMQSEAPPPAAKPARPSSPPRPRLTLPKMSGAGAAIVAGAAVVVLLIVVLIVGGGDDSGEGAATAAGEGTAQTTSNPVVDGKEVTQAVLGPVGDADPDAEGLVTFGRVKNALALQIEASGLAPTGKGESYTIWLFQSPSKMLPLASTRVDKSGKIGAQVKVPAEVLAYLANETFTQIDIALTTDATLKASLAKATREKKAPLYTGEDVLRGPITGPIVGAAEAGN